MNKGHTHVFTKLDHPFTNGHTHAFARLGPKKLTLAAEYADTATPSCQLSVLLEVPSGWRVER